MTSGLRLPVGADGTWRRAARQTGSGDAIQLRFDKRGDKTRHRRREIVRLAHQMDRGKFGLMLPGEIGLDPARAALRRT